MIDEVDIAAERSERDLQAALAAHAERRAPAPLPPGALAGICYDCERPIEPKRLRALHGCAIRCAACAKEFERSLKPRMRVTA